MAPELARRVAATLAPPDDALRSALAETVHEPGAYEASVRGGTGTLRAGRMMIERAQAVLLDAIALGLDVPIPSRARLWVERCVRDGLPLILGWDRRDGGARRCAKVYVNASDASSAVRRSLVADLVPELTAGPAEGAAVLGINACANGSLETKAYVQSKDATALAGPLAARARDLAAAARAEGADAGGVVSFDIEGDALRPRAFFVALREPVPGHTWACVRALPGWDEADVAALLPFPAAAPRSVGVALGGPEWTVYHKPRGSMSAPESLEPAAIFSSGAGEVGVFVEPAERAGRAFRRTEQHAISVRVRAGSPSGASLEALVDWFALVVRAEERGAAPDVGGPPAPWVPVASESRR